jgi:hypothetical protein
MKLNILYVTFAMSIGSLFMFMTDTTTMDFQDAVIVHVTNVMMIYLVYQAVQIDIMLRAYEIIMGVIKDKTVEGDAVEYYKTAGLQTRMGII